MRDILFEAWQAGVAAADPVQSVQDAVPGFVAAADRVVAIAFGKAAAGMMAGLCQVLGRDPDDGLVVVPHGVEVTGRLPVIHGGHPLPDEGSVRAGAEAIRLARSARHRDVVVVLVSGGGSALLASPTIPLETVRCETQRLLRSGADIHELNAYRRSVSNIKGGGLAAACRDARLVTLIVSDVVGDDPEVIASGPTMGNHPRHEWSVVTSGSAAANAAAAEAQRRGFTAAVRSVALAGEARAAGASAAGSALNTDVAVLAGETTVTVRGPGRGGRNQEAALAAAVQIAGTERLVLCAGTDGIDGPTAAAGALVDGSTVDRGVARGRDPVADLAGNDSFGFFEATGDLIITGPTGTNVGDLWLVAAGSQTPRPSRNSTTTAS